MDKPDWVLFRGIKGCLKKKKNSTDYTFTMFVVCDRIQKYISRAIFLNQRIYLSKWADREKDAEK